MSFAESLLDLFLEGVRVGLRSEAISGDIMDLLSVVLTDVMCERPVTDLAMGSINGVLELNWGLALAYPGRDVGQVIAGTFFMCI